MCPTPVHKISRGFLKRELLPCFLSESRGRLKMTGNPLVCLLGRVLCPQLSSLGELCHLLGRESMMKVTRWLSSHALVSRKPEVPAHRVPAYAGGGCRACCGGPGHKQRLRGTGCHMGRGCGAARSSKKPYDYRGHPGHGLSSPGSPLS